MKSSQRLPLENIRIDGATQPRCAINGDVVADYAEAMQEGAKFPPVTVFFDGVDYWLSDGFHRYHASTRSQFREIDCDVKRGTQRDAIWYALGANKAHGLQRTPGDRTRALERILADPEWSKMSQGVIAAHVGVSQPYVSQVSARLISSNESNEPKPKAVTGQDGRTTNTENIGKAKGSSGGIIEKPQQAPPAPERETAPPGDLPPFDWSPQDAWEDEWVNRETCPSERLEKARKLVLKAAVQYAEAKESGRGDDITNARDTLDYVACCLLESERAVDPERVPAGAV